MLHIDVKYLRLISSQLPHFKQKADHLFNFRCVVCGDSEKNTYKARGYLFRKDDILIYKCHNCGDSRPFSSILQMVNPDLHKQYVLERYAAKARRDRHDVPLPTVPAPQFSPNVDFNDLLSAGAVKVSDLPDTHEVFTFIRERKIPVQKAKAMLYFIDDEEKLERLSDKYKNRIHGHTPRLLMPYTNERGTLVGVSGRAIGPSGLRYLTLKFASPKDAMIFGLDRFDASKPGYVTEGPLDSLFLPNCIAAGGSDFSKVYQTVDQNNIILIFDREPKNRDIVRNMRGAIAKGYKVCILPNTLKGKDLNDFILEGYDVKKLVDENVFVGLAANLRLTSWTQI